MRIKSILNINFQLNRGALEIGKKKKKKKGQLRAAFLSLKRLDLLFLTPQNIVLQPNSVCFFTSRRRSANKTDIKTPIFNI